MKSVTTKPTGNQDAFDRAWQHAVVNRSPQSVVNSPEGERSCRYLIENDDMQLCCLVGCMLPDRLARLADQGSCSGGQVIGSVIQEHDEVARWFEHVSTDLLELIQLAHDSLSVVVYEDKIGRELCRVARMFNLNVPAV